MDAESSTVQGLLALGNHVWDSVFHRIGMAAVLADEGGKLRSLDELPCTFGALHDRKKIRRDERVVFHDSSLMIAAICSTRPSTAS